MIPDKLFLAKGVGKHKEKLASFEGALREAGLARFNIVKVSSILPPGCDIISREEGFSLLSSGEIVHCVMAEASTNEPHRLVCASTGLAIPKDRKEIGYLSEHTSFGESELVAGNYAEDLAAEMLATVLGVSFNPDSSWDEKRELWRISGKIVHTVNITQSAVGSPKGLWTTVIAAAVFIGGKS
ncbi:arginine decarboxylase, pyruvoyl-dependent [candidate division WOR-3 bacterium]|nr:arginine decarboxylase, pyruvoyl-dependent [candidate division WOR-3 bacterium]